MKQNTISLEPVLTEYHSDWSNPISAMDMRLYQIGRLQCTSHIGVPLHVQPNHLYELTVVQGGKGTVASNGVPTAIYRGDIYISFRGDFHAIASDPEDPLLFDFLAFNSNDPELGALLADLEKCFLSPRLRVVHDNRILDLMDALLQEFATGTASTRLLHAIMTQIAVYLIRDFQNTQVAPVPTKSEAELLCQRLKNYIDTHIYSMQSLSDIAAETNYNYSYLSTLFRQVTSGTLLDYYRSRRMEAARLMIDEHTMTLTQIAEKLHYSSIYAFSRSFKAYYGVAPNTYIKSGLPERPLHKPSTPSEPS